MRPIVLPAVMVIVCLNAFAQAPQKQQPSGTGKTGKTKTLEMGSKAMQSTDPVNQLHIYLVGFHPMKDHPEMQMEAHHFCHQVNEDFAQCALFDRGTKDANLTGIEYIISEKLFESLPATEKHFWHPHNYEILSGELVAPGLPDKAEHDLMRKKVNSYGKTWHVWMSGMSGGPNDKLPMGDPHLAWSFSSDGEIRPGMVEARDKQLKVDTAKKRQQRADLAKEARPQEGVDAIRSAFPNASGRPAGVVDKKGAGSQQNP